MQNFSEIEKKILETKSGFRAKNIKDLEEKIDFLIFGDSQIVSFYPLFNSFYV